MAPGPLSLWPWTRDQARVERDPELASRSISNLSRILHCRPIKGVSASAAIPFGHPLPRLNPSGATAFNLRRQNRTEKPRAIPRTLGVSSRLLDGVPRAPTAAVRFASAPALSVAPPPSPSP
ncbi:hypothetical protein U9M48_027883 [Paspalum notatum var. saurae]|uniref:Uncharacterized protein n=1 Tax=Paspalum notatum var. saurae TaxID=547442 RepID=A0AAQ3X0L7_PASNO